MIEIEMALFADELASDLEKAAAVASKRTSMHLKRWARRTLSKKLRINEKVLSSRFKSFVKSGGSRFKFSKIWIGSKAVGVHRLGTPAERRGGVAVNHRFYDEAFIQPLETNQPLVFKRLNRRQLAGLVRHEIRNDIDAAELKREASRVFEIELNLALDEIRGDT